MLRIKTRSKLFLFCALSLQMYEMYAAQETFFNDSSLASTIHKVNADLQLLYSDLGKDYKLNEYKVTIFGGSQIQDDSLYGRAAYQFSKVLAADGATIITGGGPGIMKAGNCGAAQVPSKNVNSLGLTMSFIGEKPNECVAKSIHYHTFAMRKIFLVHLADAFVFFPGGYGTLDELGEVLTLVGTGRLEKMPIILFGKEYWEPFMKWMKEQVFSRNLVHKEYENIMKIVDSVDEAKKILRVHKASILKAAKK